MAISGTRDQGPGTAASVDGRFLSQPRAFPDVGDAVWKGLLRLLYASSSFRLARTGASCFSIHCDSGTDPAPTPLLSQLTPDGNLDLKTSDQLLGSLAGWLVVYLIVLSGLSTVGIAQTDNVTLYGMHRCVCMCLFSPAQHSSSLSASAPVPCSVSRTGTGLGLERCTVVAASASPSDFLTRLRSSRDTERVAGAASGPLLRFTQPVSPKRYAARSLGIGTR